MVSKKKKNLWIVLGSFILLLIAIRIALPYILLRVVNKQLSGIKGYYGHVNDIDVALYRGAYTLKDTNWRNWVVKSQFPSFRRIS